MNTRTAIKAAATGALILTVLVSLVLTVIATNGAATSTDKPYFERYSATPEASVSVRGTDGTWAAATTVSGNSQRELLDEKLSYIEEIYERQQGQFVMAEGITPQEASDMDSVRYLYDQSAVYRELATVSDTLHIQSPCSFSRLANADQPVLYERYVFHLNQPATLDLSVSYDLAQGQMAFWIISPDGELLHQSEAGDRCNGTVSIPLKSGLHSLILVSEMENGQMKGDMAIEGNFRY